MQDNYALTFESALNILLLFRYNDMPEIAIFRISEIFVNCLVAKIASNVGLFVQNKNLHFKSYFASLCHYLILHAVFHFLK